MYIYLRKYDYHTLDNELVLDRLRIQAFVFAGCSLWPEAFFKRWHLMRSYGYLAGFCFGCPERPLHSRNTLILDL